MEWCRLRSALQGLILLQAARSRIVFFQRIFEILQVIVPVTQGEAAEHSLQDSLLPGSGLGVTRERGRISRKGKPAADCSRRVVETQGNPIERGRQPFGVQVVASLEGSLVTGRRELKRPPPARSTGRPRSTGSTQFQGAPGRADRDPPDGSERPAPPESSPRPSLSSRARLGPRPP